MSLTYELYIDDSGSRSLDITPQPDAGRPDSFALGGIFIPSENARALFDMVVSLKAACEITAPLRSYDIRKRKQAFAWLARNDERAKRLYDGIGALVAGMPGWATAVVIDRNGYNARYREKYGNDRWLLCRSAYDILIERAAKIADADGRRLKVFVEATGKREDNLIRQYHANLPTNGLEFAPATSDKYRPLSAEDFARITMKNPEFVRKGNPLSDLADLVLFPMVMGKYNPDYAPFRHIRETGKLIDARLKDGQADLRRQILLLR